MAMLLCSSKSQPIDIFVSRANVNTLSVYFLHFYFTNAKFSDLWKGQYLFLF